MTRKQAKQFIWHKVGILIKLNIVPTDQVQAGGCSGTGRSRNVHLVSR